MTDLDISEESLQEHSDKYESLLCPKCKEKLKIRCLPIIQKLNRGVPPFPREMTRLMRSLCPDCLLAVMQKKTQEDAKK